MRVFSILKEEESKISCGLRRRLIVAREEFLMESPDQ